MIYPIFSDLEFSSKNLNRTVLRVLGFVPQPNLQIFLQQFSLATLLRKCS
ncbi:hypothetical protein GXM_02354 [Nostoc sphaeroides CCNUC1]|uniref:Uncharacterized protein n=1 Tax=Nostoc sphaeroides CCNUC1 TaxID=2653204 RepID=A0A5P8VYI7_9NOSO|nr:hypothetical protein GXM_02354 [Nostoc sphaeroides CCNUC1]